nr:cellulose synthase-like protein e2 [Quercus suber]
MVINTILSVMAYDYPPEKLNVYLSDDVGSDLTFYAMLEASRFSKIWLPFCKKFKVEPTSLEAYFRTTVEPLGEPVLAKEWSTVNVHLFFLGLHRNSQPLSVPVPDWLTTFTSATTTGYQFPLLYVQP